MTELDLIRTYPCPQCGEIRVTGPAECSVCGTRVDASAAETLADRHEQFHTAWVDANSLVLTARVLLVFFCLSFVPFVSSLGEDGTLLLRIWVPFLILGWYFRYGKPDSAGDEYRQARKWVQQAVAIWGLALFTTPLQHLIRSGHW